MYGKGFDSKKSQSYMTPVNQHNELTYSLCITKKAIEPKESIMSEVNYTFTVAFEEIDNVIDFNANWHNGTGYFNGAVQGAHAPKLEPGQAVKSTDENGRRIILVGTRFGNAVMFDRYDPSECGVHCGTITTNLPHKLNHMFGARLSADEVARLCNNVTNIGKWLEELF